MASWAGLLTLYLPSESVPHPSNPCASPAPMAPDCHGLSRGPWGRGKDIWIQLWGLAGGRGGGVAKPTV